MINFDEDLDEFLNDEILPRKAKIILSTLCHNLLDKKNVEIDIFSYSKLLKKKPVIIVRYLILLHAYRLLKLKSYDLEAGLAVIEPASKVEAGEES